MNKENVGIKGYKFVVFVLLIALLLCSMFNFSYVNVKLDAVELFEFSEGSGSIEDPYQISNIQDFKLFVDYCNNYETQGIYFKLVSNLDLNNESVLINSFSGNFDGNNYVIYNYSLKNTDNGENYGFFNQLYNSTITNFRLYGGQINLRNVNNFSISVGAIAGRAENSVLTNCYNLGCNLYVDGRKYIYAGGLLGEGRNVKLNLCLNYGNIEVITVGTSYVGGLIGYSSNDLSIKECANLGNISSGDHGSESTYVGGIVADISGYNIEIENCFNKGNLRSYAKTVETTLRCYIYANREYDTNPPTVSSDYYYAKLSLDSQFSESKVYLISPDVTQVKNCYSKSEVYTTGKNTLSYDEFKEMNVLDLNISVLQRGGNHPPPFYLDKVSIIKDQLYSELMNYGYSYLGLENIHHFLLVKYYNTTIAPGFFIINNGNSEDNGAYKLVINSNQIIQNALIGKNTGNGVYNLNGTLQEINEKIFIDSNIGYFDLKGDVWGQNNLINEGDLFFKKMVWNLF